MNLTVIIDWKFVVALGVAGSLVKLACKADSSSAEKVLTAAVSASKELVAVYMQH